MPADLGCALAQARDHGEELLLRLLVALERETGRPLPYAAFGDLADEPMVQRVRAELPEVSAESAVPLVCLPDNAAATWPATASCFVRMPNAEFTPAADVACSRRKKECKRQSGPSSSNCAHRCHGRRSRSASSCRVE